MHKEFVENEIKKLEEMILVTEINYRTLAGLQIKKPNDENIGKEATNSRALLSGLKQKLGTARALLKEIENGEYTI